MSILKRCNICGRWEPSQYCSEAELNFLRSMGGSKKYLICYDCAKQLEAIFDRKVDDLVKFNYGDSS